jgi:hypothetical protein
MSGRSAELVVGPLRAMRRPVFGWSVGLGSLVAATVAFWPAFQGSSGLSHAIDQLPAGVVSAFGLGDFGTPAGYLRGNLCELLLPLMLAGAAVALVNGQTASEEAGGRLALAGYLVAARFPLSSVLAPLRHLSPWDWAFGGDPLVGATETWRYVALAVPSVLLVAIGLWLVSRRDIAAG